MGGDRAQRVALLDFVGRPEARLDRRRRAGSRTRGRCRRWARGWTRGWTRGRGSRCHGSARRVTGRSQPCDGDGGERRDHQDHESELRQGAIERPASLRRRQAWVLEDERGGSRDWPTGAVRQGDERRVGSRRQRCGAAGPGGPEGRATSVLGRQAQAALFFGREVTGRIDRCAAVIAMRGRAAPGSRCGHQVWADDPDGRAIREGGAGAAGFRSGRSAGGLGTVRRFR
jgi:hypothetical protein